MIIDISNIDIKSADIAVIDVNHMNKKKVKKYLPLTESSAYILLALCEPLHGYAVMQKVAVMSKETVTIGAGTLYTAFSTLEKQKLIAKAGQEGRRKLYVLTDLGKEVLAEHIKNLAILVENARLEGISKSNFQEKT